MAFRKRAAVLALVVASGVTGSASAFSQLGREDGSVPSGDGVISTPLPPLQPSAPAATEAPATTAQDNNGATAPAAPAPSQTQSPAPDTAAPPADAEDAQPAEPPAAGDAEEGTDPAASQQALPQQPSGPPPDVVYGDSELPAPVRDVRAKLLEAAKSGDIEKLRPFLETGEDGTVLSFSGVEGDPIEYLKTASGDGQGVETMAILLEVLEAGHIRSETGTENEIYVWPYFAGLAIDSLTKPQQVELFELVTAGDYQEMKGFGAYNFYRIGISPDGKLQFFVAGD